MIIRDVKPFRNYYSVVVCLAFVLVLSACGKNLPNQSTDTPTEESLIVKDGISEASDEAVDEREYEINDIHELIVERNIAQCSHNIYLSEDVLIFWRNIYKRSGNAYISVELEGKLKNLIDNKKYCQYQDSIIIKDGNNVFSFYNVSDDTCKALSLESYLSSIIDFDVCDEGMLCLGAGLDGRRCVLYIDPENLRVEEIQIGDSFYALDMIACEDNHFILLTTDETGIFSVKMKANHIAKPQEIMAYNADNRCSISAVHKDVLYLLSTNRRTEDHYDYFGFDMDRCVLTDQGKLESPWDTLRLDTEHDIFTIPWNYWRGSAVFYDDSRQISIIDRITKKQENVKVDLDAKEKMVGLTVVKDTLVLFIEDMEKGELFTKKIMSAE